MSKSIGIDPELIENYKREAFSDESNSEDAAPQGPEALDGLNQAAGILLELADGLAKENDMPGFGENPEKSIPVMRDLSIIVAKRNYKGDIIKKSPEILLATMIGGFVVQNGVAWFKNQKGKSKKVQTESESETKNKSDNE